jgi:hypothetical protein
VLEVCGAHEWAIGERNISSTRQTKVEAHGITRETRQCAVTRADFAPRMTPAPPRQCPLTRSSALRRPKFWAKPLPPGHCTTGRVLKQHSTSTFHSRFRHIGEVSIRDVNILTRGSLSDDQAREREEPERPESRVTEIIRQLRTARQ